MDVAKDLRFRDCDRREDATIYLVALKLLNQLSTWLRHDE
jgi:hypothetical protein